MESVSSPAQPGLCRIDRLLAGRERLGERRLAALLRCVQHPVAGRALERGELLLAKPIEQVPVALSKALDPALPT